MRLLRFVGHPVPRHRSRRLVAAPYSYVVGFRRLPVDTADLWDRLLRGASREALETLALQLIEHAAARVKRAEIQEDLQAIARFFEEEACALARVRAMTGYALYPVPQRDRDPLFARCREAAPRSTVTPWS